MTQKFCKECVWAKEQAQSVNMYCLLHNLYVYGGSLQCNHGSNQGDVW